MMESSLLYVAGGGALTLWLVGKLFQGRKIYREFGVSGLWNRVISADVGGKGDYDRIFLKNRYVQGEADAIFASRIPFGAATVGEFKSRKYRGKVKLRELYQVTLYMGLVSEQLGYTRVRCKIRYADKVVSVRFNRNLYKKLIKLAPEAIKAAQTWQCVNPTPLKNR